MSVSCSDNHELSRYEIRVGEELAGWLEYEQRRGIVALMHSETQPEHKGRGLAKQLVGFALEDAREQGLWVLPFCPFVLKFVAGDDRFVELVPGDLRANFDLPAP